MYGVPTTRHFALIAALVVLGMILPALVPVYYLYIGNVLMMYLVLVMGLDLLLGWAGQFAFAHTAFFGIGIYGTAVLGQRFGLPFLLAMPIAAAAAGVTGFLIAIPATRLRTVYLALATFAFSECSQWVARTWESVTNGANGMKIKSPQIFGYLVDSDKRAFPVVSVVLALMLFATIYLLRSRLARDLGAIRESEHIASASGIDVKRTKIVVFVISAIYAGVAGGVYTLFNSFVIPDMLGVTQLVLLLTMIVVGGSGSLPGIIIGVLLIGLLPEVLRAAPRSMLVWQEFAYGLILILSIMFMPRGIWGSCADWVERRRSRAARAERETANGSGMQPSGIPIARALHQEMRR
jgi:branched-chain amino acid transport system permease protein